MRIGLRQMRMRLICHRLEAVAAACAVLAQVLVDLGGYLAALVDGADD